MQRITQASLLLLSLIVKSVVLPGDSDIIVLPIVGTLLGLLCVLEHKDKCDEKDKALKEFNTALDYVKYELATYREETEELRAVLKDLSQQEQLKKLGRKL